MEKLKYREILALNQKLGNDLESNEYSVGIISNIIVNQLKEIFEFVIRSEQINATCTVGNYDNIIQDSKLFKNHKLVIIFWELANIVDGLQYKADLMSEKAISELIHKVKSELEFVFKNLESTPKVLINSFSTLVFNQFNIEQNKFDKLSNQLNTYLEKNKPPNFTIIEIDKVIAGLSISSSIDTRYFYSSKALYSIDFYVAWSKHVLPIIRSLNGKAKKALIFDCDNTLWKGILGEDGFDKILLSANQPGGAPFEEVQSLAKHLSNEGIIIGLCSKNNRKDVEEVLIEHKKMTLRNENLTVKEVNWDNKGSNLEKIARSLNIGKDSIVFVDDSNFEINFINEVLPEITTIQVPKSSSEYPKVIRENLGLFYNASKTSEDRKRIKMYKDQLKREEAKIGFENLEAYIKSLNILLEIFIDEHGVIPRISQMTQKTNQFNLTTKRYTEAEIRELIDSPKASVIAIGVSDKFGDNGITGLAIIKNNSDEAELDTLLMSCRIIGRNIEKFFFDFIVSFLKEIKVTSLKASYIKTLKNSQVKNFFDDLGFMVLNVDQGNKYYTLNLADYNSHKINYMQIKKWKKD